MVIVLIWWWVQTFFSKKLKFDSGIVDYDMLEKTATLFRPKLIIAGASAYPRDFDYPWMRKVRFFWLNLLKLYSLLLQTSLLF